jgi:probable HAF family extracellular repeat protein
VDGAMTDLGRLGGTSSAANAINASGQIAGASQITGDSAWHAFLYTGMPGVDGVMDDLGTLGGTGSAGFAINALGQIVGASDTTGDAAEHAFFYTGTPDVDGVMIDLDAWLDANYPAEGANWTLTDAAGLTDTGLITGTGQYDDGPDGLADGLRAYILDASALVALVPKPGDVNFDGVVDIFDVNLVSAHWGEAGPTADANGDGTVDIFDVNLISANWTPSGGAVPEPALFVPSVIALLGLVALGWRRRR